MVAGHAQNLVSRMLQSLEKPACLAELLGTRALSEIAADDDKVRFQLVNATLSRLDHPLVVLAKMEVGEMRDAGHVC